MIPDLQGATKTEDIFIFFYKTQPFLIITDPWAGPSRLGLPDSTNENSGGSNMFEGQIHNDFCVGIL
jgi:hypothetical protein